MRDEYNGLFILNSILEYKYLRKIKSYDIMMYNKFMRGHVRDVNASIPLNQHRL